MALESIVGCVALSSSASRCRAELQFGEMDQKYGIVLGFFSQGHKLIQLLFAKILSKACRQ